MGKKRAQLKSAGEESNKNVDVVPVRAIQPCGEVTLIGEGGGLLGDKFHVASCFR